MSYDGFISYSHAADDLLAPRLQSGLQRFAKPWWKRRALRVFRDESSLSANPHLWESITQALDTSRWFVLLLSPDAAESEWVNQEISYWVEHKDASRILPVVTAGEFGWADGDVTGDAVPAALRGVLVSEPRWVDLRFAKGEEQLDLQDPRFADAIADVSVSGVDNGFVFQHHFWRPAASEAPDALRRGDTALAQNDDPLCYDPAGIRAGGDSKRAQHASL